MRKMKCKCGAGAPARECKKLHERTGASVEERRFSAAPKRARKMMRLQPLFSEY